MLETLDSKLCKEEKEEWEMIDSSYWEMMNPLRARKRTQSKNWKIFLLKIQRFWKWLNCHEWPTKRKLKNSFLRWSYCNRWPTQMKNTRFFKLVKNTKIFQSSLIIMGTCLGEKHKDFSKWSYYNGWPTYVKNAKSF